MKRNRLTSILILLVLTSPGWSATRTFTNGGVNDLASTAGNWDTPPAAATDNAIAPVEFFKSWVG